MVLFSLCSGAALNVMFGNLHDRDLRLLHGLWEALKQGDILLGDRAFGEFTCLAGLPKLLGVDVRCPPAPVSQSRLLQSPAPGQTGRPACLD
jgi:hypothetical protein